MKKLFVRVICLVMILSMVTLVSGCSSEQDKFVGTWQAEVNMADFFNEGVGEDEEMAEYLSVDEFILVLQMSFADNGTYKMTVNETAAAEALESLKEDLKSGMQKYFESVIAESGLSMSVDEMLSLSGTTMDALLEEALGEELLDEMISEMTSEGNFEAEDGKLYLSDGLEYGVDKNIYETYEISEDEMKWLESVGSEDEEGMDDLYPLTFKKVK